MPYQRESPSSTRRMIVQRAFAVALATVSISANAQEDELKAVRSIIEGVYALEEWHADGKVFTPPQVEGRVIYLNNATMFIIHNRIREASQVSLASWGDYTLSRTEFSYRYTEPAAFTIAPSGVTHARRVPWEGYRTFTLLREGNSVRLTGKTTPQEFLFSSTSLVFTEGSGSNVTAKRVYRRVVAP